MNTTLKKRIEKFVSRAIPAEREFEIFAAPTGFDGSYVVRVITPAWQRLDKAQRITRVEQAVLPNLTEIQRKSIFRTSVLTPGEWSAMKDYLAEKGTKRIGGRKTIQVSSVVS